MIACARTSSKAKVINYFTGFFLPPNDDWPIIPWQPLLFLSTWVTALILLFWGDFTNIPPETADQVRDNVGVLWVGLSLACPPLGLWSMHLIRHKTGATRYRGLWLRLAADLGQLAALTVYSTVRFSEGDYHIYSQGILVAALIFVSFLVYRDCRTLLRTELLARHIVRRALDGEAE